MSFFSSFFASTCGDAAVEEPANFYPRDLLLGLATDYENNSYFNVKPVGRARARGGRAGRAGRIGYVLLGCWVLIGRYAAAML